MNCDDFQQRLEQALDGHGPSSEQSVAFDQHVQQCGNDVCATMWSECHMLREAVTHWNHSLPEVDLVEAVVGELHQPAVSARRAPVNSPVKRNWSWPAVATLTAAVVLAALLILNPVSDRLPEIVTQQGLANESFVRIDDVRPLSEPSSRPSADFVASYAAMPLSATEFVTDAVALVVPADLEDSETGLRRSTLWADHLEKKWEPIGKELSSAFEVLLKAVPKSPTLSL